MAGNYSPGGEVPVPRELEGLGQRAREAGLALRAVQPAGPVPAEAAERLNGWLDEGRAGEMHYLERTRRELTDLRAWKPWARSVALFRMPYGRDASGFRGGGRVARYALGRDYHHVLGRRLEKLGRRLREAGAVVRFRAATDAAPVMEREWALAGGLGFRGKNTLVLQPEEGSWFFLGELLVDAEWPTWSAAAPAASCGSCTRCLQACPTDAFPNAYSLDPRRCISYLTIESRRPIPRELRAACGEWVFGCDVCMEVCPFGTDGEDHAETWGTLPALREWTLEDLLASDLRRFEEAFRGSPLRRPGWGGLLRNACVVLGNLGRGRSALTRALEHPEALVRGHAAWALGRMGERAALDRALPREDEEWVREELTAALEACV